MSISPRTIRILTATGITSSDPKGLQSRVRSRKNRIGSKAESAVDNGLGDLDDRLDDLKYPSLLDDTPRVLHSCLSPAQIVEDAGGYGHRLRSPT